MILAKILLKELFYRIDFAMNGEMALNIMNSTAYDILIIDLDMPVLNGYQLIKHVRSNEAHKDIPIIVLSARAMNREKEKALRLGANSFITKPYKKETLLKQIHVLISR